MHAAPVQGSLSLINRSYIAALVMLRVSERHRTVGELAATRPVAETVTR
jgi:hypothetical protein